VRFLAGSFLDQDAQRFNVAPVRGLATADVFGGVH
jgi:hypothetical protein